VPPEVPLQPLPGPGPLVDVVAERHHYVQEAAVHLVVLGVSDPADLLWLGALPAGHVQLNPLGLGVEVAWLLETNGVAGRWARTIGGGDFCLMTTLRSHFF
jgi:hypothetical protein